MLLGLEEKKCHLKPFCSFLEIITSTGETSVLCSEIIREKKGINPNRVFSEVFGTSAGDSTLWEIAATLRCGKGHRLYLTTFSPVPVTEAKG